MNLKKMFLLVFACCQVSFPIFAVGGVSALRLNLYKDNLYVCYLHIEIGATTLERNLLLPVTAIPQNYQDKLVGYKKFEWETGQTLREADYEEKKKIRLQLEEHNKAIINGLISILQGYNQRQKDSSVCFYNLLFNTGIDNFFQDTHFDQQVEEIKLDIYDCSQQKFNR